MMAKEILISCLLLAATSAAATAMNNPFNNKTVLFLGDSITYSGGYIAEIETDLRLEFPKDSFTIINCGLPSETVSGLSEPNHAGGAFARPDLHERLARVLTKIRPDIVFACYGMNDGVFLPFDQARFQAYQEGLRFLHRTIQERGAVIIHLTPSPYEDLEGKYPFYPDVVAQEASWLVAQREAGWEVIDVFHLMQARSIEEKKENVSFHLAEDGVHPGRLGHELIAREILKTLGIDDGKREESFDLGRSELLNKVTERQELLRDSWLTSTRHTRPGLPVGLSLDEAEKKAQELEVEISRMTQALGNQKNDKQTN